MEGDVPRDSTRNPITKPSACVVWRLQIAQQVGERDYTVVDCYGGLCWTNPGLAFDLLHRKTIDTYRSVPYGSNAFPNKSSVTFLWSLFPPA